MHQLAAALYNPGVLVNSLRPFHDALGLDVGCGLVGHKGRLAAEHQHLDSVYARPSGGRCHSEGIGVNGQLSAVPDVAMLARQPMQIPALGLGPNFCNRMTTAPD